MGHDGLLIGEVAKRSGASRKALRLYEAAGILPAPRRTQSGYRVYSREALDLFAFVRQAQRLGFTLDDIKEIVGIKRAGRAPCLHVRELVQRKAEELNQQLLDLTKVRNGLRALLNDWRRAGKAGGVVCPHIGHASGSKKGRRRNGQPEDVALPIVHPLAGSRHRGRRGPHRGSREPRGPEEGRVELTG